MSWQQHATWQFIAAEILDFNVVLCYRCMGAFSRQSTAEPSHNIHLKVNGVAVEARGRSLATGFGSLLAPAGKVTNTRWSDLVAA